MSNDEKIDALLKDMGMEPLKLPDPFDEELEEFFSSVDVGVVKEGEEEFSREWYEAFLDGKIGISLDDPYQTMEDFIRHAEEVCGRRRNA